MVDWWTVGVAIYAAVVATGALFLEVRRWAESGARLQISVMPNANLLNLPGVSEKAEWMAITVTNRGGAPTTITLLVLYEFANAIQRCRWKPAKMAFVTNPAIPGQRQSTPALLQPGEIWHGIIDRNSDLIEWIGSGQLYVGVSATHQDRPTLVKVRNILPPSATDPSTAL